MPVAVPVVLSQTGPGLYESVSALPWPIILAAGSILAVYALFKERAEVFREIGFSLREVTLLCLGSIAGWGVNIPILPVGDAFLTVNLGGALIPVFLVAWWIRSGKLDAGKAVIGIVLVSIVAFFIVRFEPDVGIITTCPTCLAPSLVALVFALLVTVPFVIRSVPVAYAAGSIGSLLGADIYNLPQILNFFAQTGGSSTISIGGAGVFDMVFLAGILAMTTDLVIVLLFRPGERSLMRLRFQYPVPPVEFYDPLSVWERFKMIADPTPEEKCHASLALSDLYIKSGEHRRALEYAYRAVDYALRTGSPPLITRFKRREIRNGVILEDMKTLSREYRLSLVVEPGRIQAGEANRAAKTIVASLAPPAVGANRLWRVDHVPLR